VATKTVKLLTKISPSAFLNSFDEPHRVLVVDETISEHTCNFVAPQPHNNFLPWNIILVAQTNTTNNFAEVTQIECVMRFSRSRFKVFLNLLVEGQSCLDQFALHSCYFILKFAFFKVPFKDGTEYLFHHLVLEVGESDEVKMPLEPWGDERLTTTWRTHCADHHAVFNLTEGVLVVLAVIPATLVHILTKDFDRRLCTVCFNFGHV
jgi:hypothetical protein